MNTKLRALILFLSLTAVAAVYATKSLSQPNPKQTEIENVDYPEDGESLDPSDCSRPIDESNQEACDREYPYCDGDDCPDGTQNGCDSGIRGEVRS